MWVLLTEKNEQIMRIFLYKQKELCVVVDYHYTFKYTNHENHSVSVVYLIQGDKIVIFRNLKIM